MTSNYHASSGLNERQTTVAVCSGNAATVLSGNLRLSPGVGDDATQAAGTHVDEDPWGLRVSNLASQDGLTLNTRGSETVPPEESHPPEEGNNRRRLKRKTKKPITKAAIRIASLNMNGGGSNTSREKWQHINTQIKDENLSILALQETHLTDETAKSLMKQFKRLHIIHTSHPTHPTQRDGVAIVINKRRIHPHRVKPTTIIEGKALLAVIDWYENSKINIMAVYAPSGNDRENAEFWEKLSTQSGTRIPKLDIMLGDLNMVESSLDRLPTDNVPRKVKEAFSNFKERHDLVDGWRYENPTNLDYTYATQRNSQRNSRSRIDRIYVPTDLLENTREWRIVTPSINSDHRMVTAMIAPKNTPFVGKGRSTVPDTITKNPAAMKEIDKMGRELKENIQSIDRNTRERNIQTLWKEYKRKILKIATEYARKRASRLDTQIKSLEKQRTEILEEQKQDETDTTEGKEREDWRTHHLDTLEKEIKLTKLQKAQRNRDSAAARHFIQGETNSKYDFAMAKTEKPRDTIECLKIPGSQPIQYERSTKRMVEIATDFHKNLQTVDPHGLEEQEYEERCKETLNNINPRLNQSEQEELEKTFEEEEIDTALRQAPNGKAPGLDGIPAELFKELRDRHKATKGREDETLDIINTLTRLYNDIAQHGVDHRTGFAEGWMCPIYKKKDKTDIGNYRPITVLNTDYKVLTKVLTNRLTKVAPDLIHEDQAGFMKNRSITDQTELIHIMMFRCTEERRNGIIVCLDQEKAYDRINHLFLWRTLEHLNFPKKFINLIKTLYETAETTIILNGLKGIAYRIIRGVRQGDPLSCLLFNLAIESLAAKIRNSKLKGIKFGNQGIRVLANLFADDTTIFLSEEDDINELFDILEKWCKVSGAKFNLEKTVLIPLGSEEYRNQLTRDRKLNERSEPIKENIRIAIDDEPIRILGSFFGHNINQEDIWLPVVEKIRACLERWGRNNLTITGRCKAANAVIGGYTQYLTKVQGMPDSIAKELERTMDDFVQNKKGEQRSNAIGRETLRRPIELGGKKLLDLKSRNEAIELMKLKAFISANTKRPTWALLTDEIIENHAIQKFTGLGQGYLTSPLIQEWRVHITSRTLPANIKRMLKAAKDHNVKFAPIRVTKQIKEAMPFWYHPATNPDKRLTYRDEWGRCQRETHQIKTVGEMIDHTKKNETEGHQNRRNCKCEECKSDRERGCENPRLCRRNAVKKLGLIMPHWDPRREEDGPNSEGETEDETELEEDSTLAVTIKNLQKPTTRDLNEHIRVFVEADHREPPDIPETQLERNEQTGKVTVWTDGSCTENGTARTKAGSGLWYGNEDARNRSLKLRAEISSNNAGELIATLVAIQDNREAKQIQIISDSEYTINALTKHIPEWLNKGFTNVQNKKILRAITGELIEAPNTIALKKVKGHSGDPGNDGADRLAAEGAEKTQTDSEGHGLG